MNIFYKRLFLIPLIFLLLISVLQSNAYAVRTVYHKTALTGGASDALDGINGSTLSNNDAAIVMNSSIVYFYILNSTSGAAESSPSVISPDSNAGDKRWILQNLKVDTVTTDTISGKTAAAQVAIGGVTLTGGTNTFNVTNGTAILDVAAGSTVNIDASLTVSAASTINQDVSSAGSPTFAAVTTGQNIIVQAATDTLTAVECKNTLVTNYGQGAENTQTLPTAASGYSFRVRIETSGTGAFHLKAGASDKIYLNGTALDDADKITLSAPAVGDNFKVESIRTGASAYDWLVISSGMGLLIDGGV